MLFRPKFHSLHSACYLNEPRLHGAGFQHRASPPHSINMSGSNSLFNRKTNCPKLIFPSWKISWLVVMPQKCSLVHYNAKAWIWLSSRGALRLDPDANGFNSWLKITAAKRAWFQGSRSMPADWTWKSFWEDGRHAGNVWILIWDETWSHSRNVDVQVEQSGWIVLKLSGLIKVDCLD